MPPPSRIYRGFLDFVNLMLKKILVILLSFNLVFNPLVFPFAWAQEQGGLGSEGEGDSTIITGDAESMAEVETIANTHEDTIPGGITAPEDPCTPLEVEVDCPSGVEISNDNLAEVADEADSSAITGGNQIEGAVCDALIDTGDALAGASIENEINTNIVLFEEGGEIDEDGEGEELEEESADGEEGFDVTVENKNEGTLTNQADVLADTGGNQANENGGEATIGTGDALAYANLFNLLNTNVVGSDFELYLFNLLEGQEGDINLNEIWEEIVGDGELDDLNLDGEESSDLLLLQNNNSAHLKNEVNVTASSGTNQANGNNGGAAIHTGKATGLANVVNFVNINLFGSQLFLVVINIFDSFVGNLILPRPEEFINPVPDGNFAATIFENQNLAEIQNGVTTAAETGTNETNNNGGDSFIGTGDATSSANTLSLVNTNIQRNNWFLLIINNLGSWLGRIFGWTTPDAAEEPDGENPTVFQLGLDSQGGTEDQNLESGPEVENPQIVIQNQNEAYVENEINVFASSGQNQASGNGGDGEIKTGIARALANLVDFINLNIFGSRWFLGLVNILGDWQGDTIFAYPDVTVNLTNGLDQVMVGGIVEYTLSYKNQGHDEANDVGVEFELPQGLTFLSDSSGLPLVVSGRTYSWFLGTLEVGEEGAFSITAEVNSDFSFEEPLSFWTRIIPPAYAAENEKESEIVASALIKTVDPESELGNNTSSVKTLVYLPSQAQGVDQGSPILEASARNDADTFVYPGDTIGFEITIKNKGEAPSYNTYLVQTLFNGVPEDFGADAFGIGTLMPGKVATLTFGMRLADNGGLPAGYYFTVAQAFGYDSDGNEVSSNKPRTEFEIRLGGGASSFEVLAAEEGEGETLGLLGDECPQRENILPYVLLFLLSSLWLIERNKRRSKAEGKS